MNEKLKNIKGDLSDKIKFMDKKNKVYFIGMGVIVVLFVLILVLSCALKDKMYTYNEVEDKMAAAAEKYLNESANINQLPVDGSETLVTMQTLVDGKYIKPFTKMLTNGSICSGEIRVKNRAGIYSYIPYLNCGTEYFSLELYKKVINNTVTSGDGAYIINDEYVYRGQNVNNYVQFDGKLWRIYKVNVNKEAVLIESEPENENYFIYDDRYNGEKENTSGINNYSISRLRNSINDYYKTSDEENDKDENIYLSDNAKAMLVPINYCVGNRSESLNKNTSSECDTVLENEYIGLLTIQEYMNVSLDKDCNAPKDPQCQNYNYLGGTKTNWWTSTGNKDNTYEVYRIQARGNIMPVSANSKSTARFVIALSNETFLRGGDGTIENPFIVK